MPAILATDDAAIDTIATSAALSMGEGTTTFYSDLLFTIVNVSLLSHLAMFGEKILLLKEEND